jgi:hypothetical protein
MVDTAYYWDLIQQRVCSKCIDGDRRGACRIGPERECSLKKYFPQIPDIVSSVQSQSIEPYETKLRNTICAICVHQSPDGVCSVRNDVECALDRYFPLIVEVIEEAQRVSGPWKPGSMDQSGYSNVPH